jgi:HK97 family phage portal protein
MNLYQRLKLAVNLIRKGAPALMSPNNRGGWINLVRESYTTAFQQDVVISQDAVLAQSSVFSCVTLIASDIAKLGLKLMQEDEKTGISSEVSNKSFSPVIRKPNHFQTRQQFIESWMLSKLSNGNTYILKQRDNRNVVVRLYILNPNLVKPLIAQNGDVYYQLQIDYLSGLNQEMPAAPASEIIHDRYNCLFHPLVGLSPIFACGLSATQGLRIQTNSVKFFENMSQPGGILTAPGEIDDTTAERLKTYWKENFTGSKAGNIVALGDGLKYEQIAINAYDAQLVEQLKMSAEQICSTYHVPGHMIGIGQTPSYNNIEALNQQYYSQCLQVLIEAAESCFEEGLALPNNLEIEFEIDDLLRMDKSTQAEVLAKQTGGPVKAPNEGRKVLNLKPLPGGDTLYLQQQNFSIEALNKRDTGEDPFGKKPAPTPPAPPPEPPPSGKDFAAALNKHWELSDVTT